MGVLESAVRHPGKKLQIWASQRIWLSHWEPPSNSVLGAGLKVNISSTLTKFLRSFLETANLGQNVILYLCTLKYAEVRYYLFVCHDKVPRRICLRYPSHLLVLMGGLVCFHYWCPQALIFSRVGSGGPVLLALGNLILPSIVWGCTSYFLSRVACQEEEIAVLRQLKEDLRQRVDDQQAWKQMAIFSHMPIRWSDRPFVEWFTPQDSIRWSDRHT